MVHGKRAEGDDKHVRSHSFQGTERIDGENKE